MFNSIFRIISAALATMLIAGACTAATDSSTGASVLSDLFSGTIYFAECSATVVGSVSLDPVYSIPVRMNQEESASAESDYMLELRDASGSSIRNIPFEVREGHADPISGCSINFADFDFIVFDPPEYTSFAIKQEKLEVLVVERSANAPSVSVTGVNENQYFSNNETIDLFWVGSDEDNDSLTYKVLYSVDGGNSYKRYFSLRKTSQTGSTINTARIPGSNRSRFGVSVSNGTRSSFTETPIFRLEEHKPRLYITNSSSSSRFSVKQGFKLSARGVDNEDGRLDRDTFIWHSSIDGSLGTGEFAEILPDQLSIGKHEITVTGVDSSGMSGTASITIHITDTVF